MRRLMIVYTLVEGTDEHQAIEALQKTQEQLPEGAFQQLCRRNEKDMDQQLRWMPFGDLVQIIDFQKASEAENFDDSSAAIAQRRRCRGMFSNSAAISCTVVD